MLIEMSRAIQRDRNWFLKNQSAVVRFRPVDNDEFAPLHAVGEVPPAFRPSICKQDTELRWVAVVDLMRLSGQTSMREGDSSLRLRLLIPEIRSLKRRQQVEAELLDAIAAELLSAMENDTTNLAA
ncbi:MAG: hypothetical protein CMP86_15465 [Gammaproteobacteria bacterium]|nr:hypothetical protein [Gammaproteobacteria bacterium]